MMKATWSAIISLVAVITLSCTAKKASSSQTDTDDPPAAVPASPGSATDASFSATIDGVSVTGRGVDALQQQNAAYVLPQQGAGEKYALFILFSTKDADDTKANYSLRFRFPPHTGTYAHRGSYDTCKCDITLNKNVSSGTLARYLADTVTINVTSMTPTRIAGTFSGNFKLSSDTPRATQTRATITDGKFDVPMATSKITPE